MRRLSRIRAMPPWLAWMNAMPSGRSRRASRRATAGIRASACLPGRSTTVVGTPASSRRPARGPGARISARGAKRSSSARITRSITISDPPSSPNGATNSAGILAVVVNSPRPRASWAPAAWASPSRRLRMRSRRRATSSGNARCSNSASTPAYTTAPSSAAGTSGRLVSSIAPAIAAPATTGPRNARTSRTRPVRPRIRQAPSPARATDETAAESAAPVAPSGGMSARLRARLRDHHDRADAGKVQWPVAGHQGGGSEQVEAVEDGHDAQPAQRADGVLVLGAVEQVDQRDGQDRERDAHRDQHCGQRLVAGS